MKQEQEINSNAFHPFPLTVLIWLLTSLILGGGWFLYSNFFDDNMDLWMIGAVTISALVFSLPAFLALFISIQTSKGMTLSRVGKIKRLIRTCYFCTVPYALVAAPFFNNGNYNYWIEYILHAAAISAILFSCSIIAMLLNGKKILLIFSTSVKNAFL